MSEFKPDTAAFASLKGKVIVLSGGSAGIGNAIIRQLIEVGANVVFGDVDKEAGKALVEELGSSHDARGTATFVRCNVTKYTDVYALFRAAYDLYKHIDHAISNAGVHETGDWFDPNENIYGLERNGPGPTDCIDINVVGSANFARVAVVFLREQRRQGADKSLTFMSGISAFVESPEQYLYQLSNHAIQGLMRAMRKPIFERDGIRVNCINPGFTESDMKPDLLDRIKAQQGLYWQPASVVANIALGVIIKGDMNGKSVYVEGGDGWELEESLYASTEQWLGKEAYQRMKANADAVAKGTLKN